MQKNLQITSSQTFKSVQSGVCHFEILACKAITSHDKNQTLYITIRLIDKNGSDSIAFDYFLLGSGSSSKIKDLCFATGNHELYQSAKFEDSDLIGAIGVCTIKVNENDVISENKRHHNIDIITYIPQLFQQDKSN